MPTTLHYGMKLLAVLAEHPEGLTYETMLTLAGIGSPDLAYPDYHTLRERHKIADRLETRDGDQCPRRYLYLPEHLPARATPMTGNR
ncbi:hypothetical protein [Amycolatopsis sp. NPDC059021]|uniref:hypothetical protein n=1 Tax=Amycolatopsis sp. NPDC059021 TaxID=3346704 RepID=UPI0036711280